MQRNRHKHRTYRSCRLIDSIFNFLVLNSFVRRVLVNKYNFLAVLQNYICVENLPYHNTISIHTRTVIKYGLFRRNVGCNFYFRNKFYRLGNYLFLNLCRNIPYRRKFCFLFWQFLYRRNVYGFGNFRCRNILRSKCFRLLSYYLNRSFSLKNFCIFDFIFNFIII